MHHGPVVRTPARLFALCALGAVGLFGIGASAAAQTRGLLPADYYAEIGVDEVAISPDGGLVAFTVTTVVEAENRRHREIWMRQLRNGSPEGEPFRFTDPTREAGGPRWSPDGRVLSFRSPRDDGDDANHTWFARVSFPGGEAYRIDGVRGAPVWSPDGAWIAYAAPPEPGPDARRRRAGWIAPDAVTRTLDPDRFDGRVVTSTRYKRDGAPTLLPHPSTRPRPQLFVAPASGGEPAQLTDTGFDVRDPVWSADGERIYFTGDEGQDDESREPASDIFVVGRDGGEPRKVTTDPGRETAPAVSPDGRRLAFLHTRGRGEPTDIRVVDVAADGTLRGIPRNLTRDWDMRPGAPAWTARGDAVRFLAGVRGNRHLFEVTETGDLIRQITSGDRRIGSVSTTRDGVFMAYTVTDPTAPAEVFVNTGDGGRQRRVTSFNDAWLAPLSLQPAEPLRWRVDGAEIQGWLMRPVGYEPGRPYPMVLEIHGGPHGAWGNTFFRTFHILSNAGFFVLYANPRGSTGYGHDFTYAITGGWGEVEAGDLVAGVDAALAAYPDIDRRRIGVSGGSYGGFMTNWLTATTDRFAAAVTSRSIADWTSLYGSSDAQDLLEFGFGGAPWEQRERYRRLSPITYVERVRAPTLIIHGENDYRTPIGDAEQWFMALRKRGVPAELVRYPRSSHGLSRTGEPWLLVDRLERIRSWFTHWLIERAGG